MASEQCDLESQNVDVAPQAAYYEKRDGFFEKPQVQKAVKIVTDVAYKAYLLADKAGEKIANFLGITDSRFQYAVDEYNRLQRLRERKEQTQGTRAATDIVPQVVSTANCEEGTCGGYDTAVIGGSTTPTPPQPPQLQRRDSHREGVAAVSWSTRTGPLDGAAIQPAVLTY